MARRFRSNRRSQGPRRLTDWIGGIGTVPKDEVTLAGQTAALLTVFDTRVTGVSPSAPFTVIRTRGILMVGPAQSVASSFTQGAYGICVISGEAYDAGVAAVPTPWSEAGDDRWMVHEYWANFYEPGVTGTDAGIQAGGPFTTLKIDSKAMRKLDFGDVLITVLENAASDTVRFAFNHRTLVKLH